ncbi:hypothetical protein GMOD_00003944 [Pyrenophora seminiperda CCB06]|uniref:Uncharacterized protein n=1 Tax=Pyrenophora seminiperda CCB06 TaxID=1302712 RepID=A0A3M7M057_9PLEO|nr:hypothetical protein GMOD_00003944 [Pyrenophora seminiperda CCB06]
MELRAQITGDGKLRFTFGAFTHRLYFNMYLINYLTTTRNIQFRSRDFMPGSTRYCCSFQGLDVHWSPARSLRNEARYLCVPGYKEVDGY